MAASYEKSIPVNAHPCSMASPRTTVSKRPTARQPSSVLGKSKVVKCGITATMAGTHARVCNGNMSHAELTCLSILTEPKIYIYQSQKPKFCHKITSRNLACMISIFLRDQISLENNKGSFCDVLRVACMQNVRSRMSPQPLEIGMCPTARSPWSPGVWTLANKYLNLLQLHF